MPTIDVKPAASSGASKPSIDSINVEPASPSRSEPVSRDEMGVGKPHSFHDKCGWCMYCVVWDNPYATKEGKRDVVGCARHAIKDTDDGGKISRSKRL